MAAAKQQLRSWIRNIRDSVARPDAARAARSAADRLLSHPAVATSSVIAVYAAIGSELDTLPLVGALRERGVALAYPRVVPNQRRLGFHRVTDLDQLVPGVFGLREPDRAAPSVPVERIDVFVVPGLAFDRDGGRLGWGAGYYDTTLADNSRAPRIGYGFECQIVERVPRGESDVAMTHVVTEAGIRVCAPGATA